MVSCFTVYKINMASLEESDAESCAEADRYVAYGNDFQKCFRNFFYTFMNDMFDSDATIESVSVVGRNNLRALFDHRSIKLNVETSEGTFTYIIYAEGSVSGISVAYKMEKIDMSAYDCGEICTDILNSNTYDYDYRIYSPEGEPMSFQRRHAVIIEASKPTVRNQDVREYLNNNKIQVKHVPPMYALTNPDPIGYCGWIDCDNGRKLVSCIITRHVW